MNRDWWLEIAQGLPVNSSTKVQHPDDGVGKSASVIVFNSPLGWGFTDFRRGNNGFKSKESINLAEVNVALEESGKSDLPSDLVCYYPPDTGTVTQMANDYLLKRGLDPNTITRIGYCDLSPTRMRLVYHLTDTSGFTGSIGRDITEKHKAKVVNYQTSGKRLKNAIFEGIGNRVWITEDVNSAIKIHDAINETVLSLNGTSICNSGNLYLLDRDVVIWLDGDDAGVNGAIKLYKDLQAVANSVKIILGEGDPKDYTYKELQEVLDAVDLYLDVNKIELLEVLK